MPDRFIFADEAGCLAFTRNQNVSKYFILCTVVMDRCDVALDLIALRKRLAWEGAPLGDYFHACTDAQVIRDNVFSVICGHDFTIQATIMEKSKAQTHIRETRPSFYRHGWYFHFKFGAAPQIARNAETLVTTASIGTKKERKSFEEPISDVMRQIMSSKRWQTDFCPAGTDPCLQVADYCAWAIQRKWERGDVRSYDLIKDRITYEYDLWARGTEHYY
jgi:hypothetical protein